MGKIIKILIISLLFSTYAFGQASEEWDDTYFFTSDREKPASISKDMRLKPNVNFEAPAASKYANPDYNGDVVVNDQGYNYYNESQVDNFYDENYVFGSNYMNNNMWAMNSPWGWGNGAYSAFNDPFFSPYYPYGYTARGLGMNRWGTGFGMNYGFGSMFGPRMGWGMGMGNGFYDPFFDPFMNPYYGGLGFGIGSAWGSPMFNRFNAFRPRVVVVERTRSVQNRINRGNVANYQRNANNASRMASYKPSADRNRVASSRIRNIEQLQQRTANRVNGRVSSSGNSSNSYSGRSSYSTGRSSSSYNRSSSNFNNSSRNRSSSFSSPSRSFSSVSSSYGRSSSGRSSAPVRRGRQ
ncbi:MAG: hypothetical protein AAGI07_10215 [Bacteroidota bacterium]